MTIAHADGELDAGALACPQCCGKAIPRSVTTAGPGRVLVVLRCQACHHEWTSTRRAQTLFDLKKPGE